MACLLLESLSCLCYVTFQWQAHRTHLNSTCHCVAKATELPTGSWQERAGMCLIAASHTTSFLPNPGALKQPAWLLLPMPHSMHQRKGGNSWPCQEQGLRISVGRDLECRAQRPRGGGEGEGLRTPRLHVQNKYSFPPDDVFI